MHLDRFNAVIFKPLFASGLMSAICNTVTTTDPEPDESMPGTAVFHLPEPIRRDSVMAQNVVFTGTTTGRLVNVEVADHEHDATRSPSPEKGPAGCVDCRLFLPADGPGPRGTRILVSSCQGPALRGKTLRACKMTSEEDINESERMEKH